MSARFDSLVGDSKHMTFPRSSLRLLISDFAEACPFVISGPQQMPKRSASSGTSWYTSQCGTNSCLCAGSNLVVYVHRSLQRKPLVDYYLKLPSECQPTIFRLFPSRLLSNGVFNQRHSELICHLLVDFFCLNQNNKTRSSK